MTKREWFDGVRLSTESQDDLVEELRRDLGNESVATGDTMVINSGGYITVYREDFAVKLTSAEYDKRIELVGVERA